MLEGTELNMKSPWVMLYVGVEQMILVQHLGALCLMDIFLMPLPDHLDHPCSRLDVTLCNHKPQELVCWSPSFRISPRTLAVVTQDVCTWWVLTVLILRDGDLDEGSHGW